MKRKNLYRLLTFLFRHITITEHTGTENVPTTGGLIVATNHLSRMDIPLLFLNPVRPDITALVTDKYMKYPLIKWFVVSAKGIWIDRTKADFTAFRIGIEALRNGQSIGISPEGTRSHTGGLIEGKSGIVLLAEKAQVPIVPVGLTGTDTAMRDLKSFRKPRLKATYGPLFSLPPVSRDDRERDLQRMTDEVMCRIAAVLPPSYRGVYADHPRLKELLEECAGVP
ncbi:MAG: 1-acyl-sn-glycerol-3-phosphate acyltransferase [Anaerolineae bacterium]|nr:1-acyl-sn-glycerol-3-phosphate acyltransferase [Anaerolineae bacterium]